MRILSWNVDGMKRVAREGFLDWLNRESPDILCLQETHIPKEGLSREFREPWPYRSYWDFEPTNFSGVAVYTKLRPNKVYYDVGLPWFDKEGKIMVLEFDNFTLVNVRFPHGWRGRGTLEEKLRACNEFVEYARSLRNRPVVICGTLNIARSSLDLHDPADNYNKATFTTMERDYLNDLLGMGFVDTYRMFNPDVRQYTSWADENKLERNVGHRIDYVLVSNGIIRTVKDSFICSDVHASDHCPVGVEMEI